MNKKSIIATACAFTLSLPAVAGTWHSATAPTQEVAMQEATAAAKARASRKGTCYKPAWIKQVIAEKPCTTTPNGVQCWATSANRYGSCKKGKHGWLSASRPDGWALPPVPIYPDFPSIPRPKPAPSCTPKDASQGRC